jgi:phosphomevalonate kinase
LKARAPGKVVLSGAYAVLRGAPALVSAVTCYAEADTSRPPEFVTPEVDVALRELGTEAVAPWFDASALRARGAKLGLGSSAAILVASLGALLAESPNLGGSGPDHDSPDHDSPDHDVDEWRRRVYERALRAHRLAQGGGSGIDVAAAALGGTLLARRVTPEQTGVTQALQLEPVTLPADLCVELWAMGHPASTAHFVRAVFDLEQTHPARFEALLEAQASGARRAAAAAQAGDGAGLLDGLRVQRRALDALGRAANVPIVVDELRTLDDHVPGDAALLPAGAGGGDISIYAGPTASSAAFRRAAAGLGMWRLEADLGAPGLQSLEP